MEDEEEAEQDKEEKEQEEEHEKVEEAWALQESVHVSTKAEVKIKLVNIISLWFLNFLANSWSCSAWQTVSWTEPGVISEGCLIESGEE